MTAPAAPLAMKKTAIAALIAVVIGLCACAPATYHNADPTYGQAQLDRDQYECQREAYTGVYVLGNLWASPPDTDPTMYKNCLVARGWQQVAATAATTADGLGTCPDVGYERYASVMCDAEEALSQQKYTAAMNSYRMAAAYGNSKAQADAEGYIGWLYDNGWGVPPDYKEAMQWYLKAAEKGNSYSQNNIGVLYLNGHGVPQDYKKAMRWCREAAKQGNGDAEQNIGWLYHTGLGVEKDDALARQWLTLAVQHGSANAQTKLDALGDN